ENHNKAKDSAKGDKKPSTRQNSHRDGQKDFGQRSSKSYGKPQSKQKKSSSDNFGIKKRK
ncbi:MAG: hypothetical protein IKM18_04090, partial [Clostridia bacterium]|nr:hypothetical protein [Clostridia bacterium]